MKRLKEGNINKVYLFNPLIKKGSLSTKNSMWVFFVAFLLPMLWFCIYYQFYVQLLLTILFFIVIFFYILNREDSPDEWYLDKYKTVKIDCTHKILWLDEEKFHLNQISSAEVFFAETAPLYWKNDKGGRGYENLINSEIRLYLKDSSHRSIPVQYKSKLRKMVSILQQYFKVNFDNNNEYMKRGMPAWVPLACGVSFLLIIHQAWVVLISLWILFFVVKYIKENVFYNS